MGKTYLSANKYMHRSVNRGMKDKCGKINSKDNYTPIALASIVSKKIRKHIVRQNVSYADVIGIIVYLCLKGSY